ncbi:peptidoglycan DD-metalloendopeptidase family protein [Formosa sp. S-31]|uniref:peptidoglycan DD-metalloendopeptidase family protein n=1 Tax=Formosa sp. S-31 TaxID=2790949 RepID=UPI003EBB9C50
MPEIILSLLKTLGNQGLRVLDLDINPEDYLQLDLSENNTDLKHVNLASSQDFSAYINDILVQSSSKVGFGGYLEQRALYKRSSYFNTKNEEEERNIHLGIDLWCEAGTGILAVWDGEIHSFKNNTNFGDYGPTIILKHKVDGITFYSLYGHLSLESISGIEQGDSIKGGTCIGALGTSEVNGDYPPHLHFQLILDLNDNFGDYPGVCSKNTLEFYKLNCPDPELLLHLKTTKND